MPTRVKAELEGRLVHEVHGLSPLLLHTPQYCPTGQADVLHATHVWQLQ